MDNNRLPLGLARTRRSRLLLRVLTLVTVDDQSFDLAGQSASDLVRCQLAGLVRGAIATTTSEPAGGLASLGSAIHRS